MNENKKDAVEFVAKAIDDCMNEMNTAPVGTTRYLKKRLTLLTGIITGIKALLLVDNNEDMEKLNNFIDAEIRKMEQQ